MKTVIFQRNGWKIFEMESKIVFCRQIGSYPEFCFAGMEAMSASRQHKTKCSCQAMSALPLHADQFSNKPDIVD
jgi:hypothetical protein